MSQVIVSAALQLAILGYLFHIGHRVSPIEGILEAWRGSDRRSS